MSVGDEQEGLWVGWRCLTNVRGAWEPATLRSVSPDGTCKLEHDEPEMRFMPFWYGVTLPELAFNDAARWPGVFARLWAATGLDLPAWHALSTRLGWTASAEQLDAFWVASCDSLWGVSASAAPSLVLDQAQSYALIRRAGLCAQELDEHLAGVPAPPYHELYWNQTRMGGRDPALVARPVSLTDAYDALGLDGSAEDPALAARLNAFAHAHGVALPPALVACLSRQEIFRAVLNAHPNNPELLTEQWDFRRGLRAHGWPADHAMTIMLPHQGDHAWAAVFDAGDADARIVLQGETEAGAPWWRLTAPSVAFFFWDLAQTGLAWYADNKHAGGKPIRQTDIGLALD